MLLTYRHTSYLLAMLMAVYRNAHPSNGVQRFQRAQYFREHCHHADKPRQFQLWTLPISYNTAGRFKGENRLEVARDMSNDEEHNLSGGMVVEHEGSAFPTRL
jgi:hypothetical protein